MLGTLNCAAPNWPVKSSWATHCADPIHRKVTMLLCCWISLQEDKSSHHFCCQVERMLTWGLPSSVSDKARHSSWWSCVQLLCLRVRAAQAWGPAQHRMGLLGLALPWIPDPSICLLRMAVIFCLDIMSLYFTVRMVRHCHRFSRDIVESLTLKVLEVQLNDCLSNVIQIQHPQYFCRRLSWMTVLRSIPPSVSLSIFVSRLWS